MEKCKALIAKFLSAAFMYPSKDTVGELKGGLDDLLLCLKLLSVQLSMDTLKNEIENLQSEECLLSLCAEYNTLFATDLKAPNWETAYELDKTGRKAYELSDIQGFYEAFGIQVKGVEPDSIVAQLEFVSLLHLKIDYAKENNLSEMEEICSKALTEFVKDHIGRWYKLFVELVTENTKENYYKELANLLKSFLDLETKDIQGIKDLVEYRKEMLEGSTWKCGIETKK